MFNNFWFISDTFLKFERILRAMGGQRLHKELLLQESKRAHL